MKSQLFLKSGCPHCLKLYIFLSETGLSKEYDIEVFEHGTSRHTAIRIDMEKSGIKPSFPAVLTHSGIWQTDSENLISQLARDRGNDIENLSLYQYFVRGLYPKYGAMRRENIEMKRTIESMQKTK